MQMSCSGSVLMLLWQVLKPVMFAKQVLINLVFSQHKLNNLVWQGLKVLVCLADTQCCGFFGAGHHGGPNHCCRWSHL